MSRILAGGAQTQPLPNIPEYHLNGDGGIAEPQFLTLWPTRSRLTGADITAAYAWPMAERWEYPSTPAGSKGYRTITGYTRDRGGNPIGNVPVSVFNSTTGELEASGTSDASGFYSLNVKTSGNYFVGGWQTGSPDQQGVTDNNITGS